MQGLHIKSITSWVPQTKLNNSVVIQDCMLKQIITVILKLFANIFSHVYTTIHI